MLCSTIVSVEDKNEKDARVAPGASAPPPTAEAGLEVPVFSAKPALDLDLEELSGSLLVDESQQRAMRLVEPSPVRPRSAPPPLPPISSRPPGPSSMPPPLPKPNPPPRLAPPPLPRVEPPPLRAGAPPDAAEFAKTEMFEPVELDVTFSPDEPVEPPPAPSSAESETLVAAPLDVHAASPVDGENAKTLVASALRVNGASSLQSAEDGENAKTLVASPLRVNGASSLQSAEDGENAKTLVASALRVKIASFPAMAEPEPAPAPPIERAEIVMPEPGAFGAPFGSDMELVTLARGPLSPPFLAPPNGAQSTSAMPPAADASGPARRRRRGGIAAAAGLVAVAALGVFAVQMRGRERAPAAKPVASAAVAAVPEPRASAAPEPGPAPVAGACVVAGDSRVVAPNAVVAAGIEVRALGDEFAMAFASGDHHATLIRLDSASLSATSSSTKPWASVVRRAVPYVGKKGRMGLAIDVDKKGDTLRGRRTLQLDPPLQVGVAGKHLAWAPLRRRPAGKLWPLEGDDSIEAPRGAESDSSPQTVAIAFRRAGALWVGEADGAGASLSAKGDLARVGDTGSMVGAPAIALNEGAVLMAWAERSTAEEPWKLRWVRFKAGEAPGAPHTFTPPPGGRGEQAMAPGLAAASGGRFLLVWTEGPASAHEVRAMTLANDGSPVGPALRISSVGVNAGQGQAAISAAGRGVVAFLESSGNGFEVVATPISCQL